MILLLIGGMAFTTGGCKSKKKLAQEQAAKEYADKVQKAISDLQAILDDDGTMPLAEMERRLNDIKSQNLNDKTVNELIVKVEDKIAKRKAELKKLEEEEQKRLAEEAERNKYNYINDSFIEVAHAADTETANMKIANALKLYASEDVPVLIIIHQEGDVVDYDKPTTIIDYLNYVKDQKKYDNKIANVKMDDYGQITELELIIK
jgi:ATP/maltotriose-dependent transcriptional regulator MalT